MSALPSAASELTDTWGVLAWGWFGGQGYQLARGCDHVAALDQALEADALGLQLGYDAHKSGQITPEPVEAPHQRARPHWPENPG
jgi:hypothetical protein